MKGSITFFSFIACIGLFLGLVIGTFLLLKKSERNKSNIYLAAIIFFTTLYLIPPFVYFIGWDAGVSFFYRFGRIGGFLIGPMIYFYIQACIQKGFKMRPVLWLHLLPAALDFLIIQIPIMMISSELKIEYFTQFMETSVFKHHAEPRLIPFLKTIHGVIYSIVSARIVLQYRKHLTESTSHINVDFHRWLLVFCTYLIYPFLVLLLFTLFVGIVINMTAFYFGFVSFIIAVFISLLVKPELFQTFPHQMPQLSPIKEKKQKYEKSNLQEDRKESFLKKLLDYFEKEKPYLSSTLTLADLAEQTQIPSHYLSQVINEKLNCSFLDFVNGYRVKEAQKMFAEGASKQFTILSIAYDSGFNSKSTFYSVFKKHVGMNPGSYRKSLKLT